MALGQFQSGCRVVTGDVGAVGGGEADTGGWKCGCGWCWGVPAGWTDGTKAIPPKRRGGGVPRIGSRAPGDERLLLLAVGADQHSAPKQILRYIRGPWCGKRIVRR